MGGILETVLPVFLLVALGKGLIYFKLAGPDFFRVSDRLVYYIFFPCLLFWKVAQSQAGAQNSTLELKILEVFPLVLGSIFTIWLLTLIHARLFKLPQHQIGAFSQVSYRFNTYVGMAIIFNYLGEQGVAGFAILISTAIPFINVLAVSTLVWFSPQAYSQKEKTKMVLKAMVTNPLILACLAGVLYGKVVGALPLFAVSSLKLLSSITLPLALLSVGSSLALDKLRGRLGPALASCLYKLLLLPVTGYLLFSLSGINSPALVIAMVFFSLPTSPASYILSKQLASDAELAGASVALSTLLSFISLSAILFLFQ